MAAWNSSQPRIEALRARWDRDPSSRLSLQLAEEYRRSGDLDQALHVLRTGIEATPSIAAEVALGRCLLEANDVAAAKVHLRRAIERDPTQMVAYRHLIEVHMRLGDRAAAESALDIYAQLNPTDPDLEALAARLRESPATAPTSERPASHEPASGTSANGSSFDKLKQAPPLDLGEASAPAVELMEAPAEPTVETATFQPLAEPESPTPSLPSAPEPGLAADPALADPVLADPVPAPRVERSATPFVSFLDRAEDETDVSGGSESIGDGGSPNVGPEESGADSGSVRPSEAPSRFGFAGEWEPSEVAPEETVPFFDREGSVFQAPQDGAIAHAVVVESEELFSLEEVERAPFELFALPSRPLRRPSRADQPAPSENGGDVLDSSVSHPAASATERAETPTETLSRLYREQGHEEEADQLDRQVQGHDESPALTPTVLKAVDFAPLRQLQGVSGVARRKLVVAGYLDRLTESGDVS